jgi:hypothetical protein
MESNTFGHLKRSDLTKIKALVETGKAQEVLKAFRKWLMMWQSGQWIDEEKIHYTVVDLQGLGVWEKTSLPSFIKTLEDAVCPEVLDVLIQTSNQ